MSFPLQETSFLVLASISAVLQITGVSTPGWWILENEYQNGTLETKSYGLWIIQTCTAGTCSSIKRDLSGELAWLLGVAVIEVLSAVLYTLGVAAAVTIVLRYNKGDHGLVMKKLYVVILGGAGAVIILGVLLFVKKKAGLTARQALATKHGDSGWSLILSSVAGSLGIVLSVAMGLTLLCSHEQEEDDEGEKKLEYWLQKHKEITEKTK